MTVEPDAGNDDGQSSHDELRSLAAGSRRAPRAARMRLGIGAAALLVVAALVVTVVVSLLAPHGSNQTVAAVTAQTAQTAPSTHTPADNSGTVVYVHVLGAVERPGLYALAANTRVVDAVAAAGGFTDDASQAGVNLARVLADGEQLQVPKLGDDPPAAVPGSGSSAPAGAAAGKVNLNTASAAELETLPRIGPSTAAKILDWRKENGRFTTVDDLMNVTGIGEKTFDSLKELVTI